jgi:hypothetical protein
MEPGAVTGRALPPELAEPGVVPDREAREGSAAGKMLGGIRGRTPWM